MTPGRYAALLLAATAVAAVVRPSFAQNAGDGFLFQAPLRSFGLHGGFDRANAGGDVFSFVTNQLTLNRADFSSASLGGNVAIRLSRTNDLVFDLTYASVARRSEFRHWVDQNNQPIEQTTSLRDAATRVAVRSAIFAALLEYVEMGARYRRRLVSLRCSEFRGLLDKTAFAPCRCRRGMDDTLAHPRWYGAPSKAKHHNI